MTQAEEIASMYYEALRYRKVPPGFKKKSIEYINQLLENGVEYPKIIKAVEYYVECYEEYNNGNPFINMVNMFGVDDIKAILRVAEKKDNGDNLIDKARFYFHRKLRLIPKAPKIIIDDSGAHTTETEPFYLEMVSVFTTEDLLEYFYEVHQVDKLYRKEKRDIAGVKYLIDLYRESSLGEINWLDLILYMIDVSRQIIIDDDKRPMTNILHIQECENEALELLEDKMNYERVNGVDKVVPRQQLDNRNGWTK